MSKALDVLHFLEDIDYIGMSKEDAKALSRRLRDEADYIDKQIYLKTIK